MKFRKKMRLFLIATMIVMTTCMLHTLDVSAADKIPAEAKQYRGHFYYAYGDASSWEDARAKCKSLGGHLATITSAKENKVVFQTVLDAHLSWAYFGLYRDNAESNDWKWVTGEKASYYNWSDGQPDNYLGWGELYGCFNRENNGTWDDGVTGVYGYVCEWDGYDVQVNEKSLKMRPKENEFLQCVIKDIDGNAVNRNVSWKSGNAKVAKVSSKGKVVAVAPGSCTITCKVGNNKKTVKVIVIPGKVTGLSAPVKTDRSIQLRWKKQTGVKGYEIYVYDPDLEEYVKTRTVNGSFNTATLRNLKKGKTYSFRIRAYVKSGSKKYYGDFSKTYKVKTKK